MMDLEFAAALFWLAETGFFFTIALAWLEATPPGVAPFSSNTLPWTTWSSLFNLGFFDDGSGLGSRLTGGDKAAIETGRLGAIVELISSTFRLFFSNSSGFIFTATSEDGEVERTAEEEPPLCFSVTGVVRPAINLFAEAQL